MSISKRSRTFVAVAAAVGAAAGLGLNAATSSFAADSQAANTDTVVSGAATVTDGTQSTVTTNTATPETATAAQVAADSTLTVDASPTSTTSTIHPNIAYAALAKGGSITRSTVLARAQSWVDEGVPYNQQGYKTDANGTYREDCSGFVSMAWNLPYSRTTWTLDDSAITTHISRSQLQPGDALDYDTEHVILFAGWKDQSAGTFYYYAESNPRVLTGEYVGNFNSSTIAGWPVSDYVYLRYNNITNDVASVATNTFYHEVRGTNGVWTGFQAPTGYDGAPTFAGAQESIAAMPNGDAQILGLGKDGNIYHNIRFSNGTWQGWRPVAGYKGATYFSGPDMAITGMPDGSSQLVAIGNDGNVYHNVRNSAGAWSGWQPIPGNSGNPTWGAKKVSVAGMPDGSSQVLVYGLDGKMYLDTRAANGTWSGWSTVAGASGVSYFSGADLAITAMPNGDAQMLAIGNDGNVWHEIHKADGTFTGWGNLAGVGTSYMAASSIAITGMPDGTSQVLAVGNDGNVYHEVRGTNGVWTGFQPLAGINGAAKFAGHQVGIAGMPNGTSQVLATTAN